MYDSLSMDSKKISFGFNKLSKKTSIISTKAPIEEKKVELIDCLEGQSIKIKDAVEEVYAPLIIPIKDNKKNLLDRIREARSKQTVVKEEPEDVRPDSELTPEELAARELMKEAKNRLENGTTPDGSKVSMLPIKSENLVLEGEKEPTLEDYESIPVADYGLALLRGMGWKDGMPIGKNVSKTALVSTPDLRPKGLGLGATKIIQSEKPKQNATDKAGNELTLVKGSYAKIIAGGEKGNYCVIQGFDEDAGRVIVQVYPRKNILNINEFMLIPIGKEEFSRGSKFLNNAKYEEYKEKSDKNLEKHREKSDIIIVEPSSSHEDKHPTNRKRYSSDEDFDRETTTKRSSKSKNDNRNYSKNRHHKDSESSDSEHYKKNRSASSSHKKSKTKSRNRSSSRDRYRKPKKQKSKSRKYSESSDSDSDYKSSKKHHKHRNRHKSSSEEDSRSHRRK